MLIRTEPSINQTILVALARCHVAGPVVPLSVPNLYDRRFVFFTGKGGVGKTTVSSAFAYSCAQRGDRTLLIEINTKDKVSLMFGSQEVGTEIIEVEDNLYAVNVTPDSAMEEYALMMLKLRIVYKALFQNRIIQSFLSAIPGINELVMLGKAYFHATEKEEGTYVWDKVIVDAPATGHGLFFLQIPQVITSILSGGPMYDEAVKMLDVLQDPEFSVLNIVTLPEEMPVNETKMLHDAAKTKLGMPLGFVVANGIYPPAFDPRELEFLHSDEPHDHALFEAARFRLNRTRLQRKYLGELYEATPLPVIRFPYVFAERLDFVAIRTMAESLRDQILQQGERQ